MTQPLALLHYESILPGGQLMNRLREVGYRVVQSCDPERLPSLAREEPPMIILVDLLSSQGDVPGAISQLREDPATLHVPIIAFSPLVERELQERARAAGATLVVASDGVLEQLEVLLNQALELE